MALEEKNLVSIEEKCRNIVEGDSLRDGKLEEICRILEESIDHYNWVGFYLVDGERELVLGPYVGAPTDHTRIGFGEGICGQAADTGKLFLIQDVDRETNYLSCSPEVRSEIVLPILKDEELAGELDIDSHQLAPFTEIDRSFLERICELVAPLL
ncbi:MAG: GAF domain-containing protein [Candidatus Thermoplasmatota archaeon]|nr:GAF domain-containing protein [Candidatus Thermoplasmatota archaeon]